MLADHSNTPFGLRDWRIEDACRSLKHAIGLKDWRIIVSFAINLRGSTNSILSWQGLSEERTNSPAYLGRRAAGDLPRATFAELVRMDT